MKKTYLKAELWDRMQHLMRRYYDGMEHSALYYDGHIDEDVFRKALVHMTDSVPVLHSRYCSGLVAPHWEVCDYSPEDILVVRESEDLEADTFRFFDNVIPASSNLQYRAELLYHEDKTAVLLLINHMCFDGGDYAYFMNALCASYNRLLRGLEPVEVKNGSRAYHMMYEGMDDEMRRKVKGLYRNISATSEKHHLPYAKRSKDDVQIFVRRKIDPELFVRMKEAGKRDGATVNDVLQAAFIRSLYEICRVPEHDGIHVSNMFDLRVHIPNAHKITGLTNHTGYLQCAVESNEPSMHEMVKKVSEGMKKAKSDPYAGMYGIPLLKLAYTIFPEVFAKTAIRIGYKNPQFSISNIGVLKGEMLSLGDAKLFDAFITGTVKHKPYVQLSSFSLNGTMNLISTVKGSAEDRKLIEAMLDCVLAEVRRYAEENSLCAAN